MKIKTLILALVLAASLLSLTAPQSKAQTQTVVAHLNLNGSTTLLVSMDTLEAAYADDCNNDSTTDFHDATFDTVYVLYTSGGSYALIGNGSNATHSGISRGFTLTLNLNNDLTVALTGGESGGTCSGCDQCNDDGMGGCNNLCGGGPNTDKTCTHSKPVNPRGAGYIGNFY